MKRSHDAPCRIHVVALASALALSAGHDALAADALSAHDAPGRASPAMRGAPRQDTGITGRHAPGGAAADIARYGFGGGLDGRDHRDDTGKPADSRPAHAPQ